MKQSILLTFAVFVVACNFTASTACADDTPLALHPVNPHYFLFRDEPTILITSGEHYGAVLNRGFDYVGYLEELAAHGLNNTRTFTGVYCEPDGAFNITKNTLAPRQGQLIAPWARSDKPGFAGGGNKFDLMKWDVDYFVRLKDFLAQAGKLGIVVELDLFCPFYADGQWKLSPQNVNNNINGIGNVPRTDVYTLDKNGALLAVHEALTRKIVRELNEFDNLYYEICNEPYFGGVTMDWQHRIVDTIVATESQLPNRHLISLNVANGSQKVKKPHPAISIFNFHYASPPRAVAENHDLNKVIGDNETGFKGTSDEHYHKEAWQFILAGGGLFNNLDYSFAVGFEDGSFHYPESQPGGGSRDFRRQMKVLKDFMYRFNFIRMHPDNNVIRHGLDKQAEAYVLVEPGRQYAAHVHGGEQVNLGFDLPKGRYDITWVNTLTGNVDKQDQLDHPGGNASLASPRYKTDIALRIIRSQ